MTAHWISSYFLGDKMRLPSTVEQALADTERKAAWIRKRYPDMLLWVNESYSSGIAFWSCVSIPFLFHFCTRAELARQGGHKHWMNCWTIWSSRACGLVETGSRGHSRSSPWMKSRCWGKNDGPNERRMGDKRGTSLPLVSEPFAPLPSN